MHEKFFMAANKDSDMLMVEKRKLNRIYYVLNVIRENPDSSKSEIKKLSGLSMEVVLNYIDYLTQNGLIYQSGKIGDGVGRKSEIYRINPDGGRFIGIKFTAHKVSGLLMNFVGTTLYVYEKKYDRYKVTASDLMSAIFECVDDIIKKNPDKGVCGIGVSSPGLVDAENGVLERYCDLIGDQSVPIGKTIEEKYGIQTYVCGTVKTKAISHYLKNKSDDYGNFAFVFIGEGCSMAFIYNNKLFSGEHNYDGEIGYIPVRSEDDSIGNLASVIGNNAIIDALSVKGKAVADIFDFVELIDKKDDCAIELLERITDVTAYVLSTVMTICVPKKIILCGDYVHTSEYRKRLEEKAEKYCLSDVFNSISFKYLKNEKSDNAYDAAQYCYFKKFYYSKRT